MPRRRNGSHNSVAYLQYPTYTDNTSLSGVTLPASCATFLPHSPRIFLDVVLLSVATRSPPLPPIFPHRTLLSCPSPVSVSAADRSVCGSKQCTPGQKTSARAAHSDNTPHPSLCLQLTVETPRRPPALHRHLPISPTLLPIHVHSDGRHVTGHFNLASLHFSGTSLMF